MDHEPGPVRGDCTVAFRREVALVQTILSALAPIVFTLLLGFVAAWRHDFGPKEASVLNRMVLLYAVPLALFVGTARRARIWFRILRLLLRYSRRSWAYMRWFFCCSTSYFAFR